MEEQNESQEQVELPSSLEELKKDLKGNKLIYGRERTVKLLRQNKLAKIFISSNAQSDLKADCETYSKISGIEIVKLDIPNDELGTFCKKTFAVSVIGLLK